MGHFFFFFFFDFFRSEPTGDGSFPSHPKAVLCGFPNFRLFSFGPP